MTHGTADAFFWEPDPANPGWMLWGLRDESRFNALYGKIWVLPEGAGRARIRFVPQPLLTNARGAMHGGALAGFIDIALFAALQGCGIDHADLASTVDLSIQYVRPGSGEELMDAVIDISRETKRMVFLRGTIEQSFGMVAGFIATVRKGSALPPGA